MLRVAMPLGFWALRLVARVRALGTMKPMAGLLTAVDSGSNTKGGNA
jgi:hypothetical protein